MRFRLASFLLCTCLLLFGCGDGEPTATGPGGSRLVLLSSHPLDIDEPSGLDLDADGSSLWTVSPERVYRLSLTGERLDRLDYRGEDIEGIACDPVDATLWIVEESRRELVHLDRRGDELECHPLPLEGSSNNGPEGICLEADGRIHILNEKDPGLFITLAPDFSLLRGYPLSFAADYSGLDCATPDTLFWIASDQSRTLYLWDPDGGRIGSYPLSIPKAEGVAVDPLAGRVYVVSDSEATLYVYRIEYPESPP